MSKELDSELNKYLEEYKDNLGDKVKEITLEIANETVNQLKQSSPTRTGKYAGSWATKDGETATGRTTQIVHNEKHYRLTHLLEWGHATVGGGRVAPRPHIARAEQEAINKFEQKLKGAIEG